MNELTTMQRAAVNHVGAAIASIKGLGLRTDHSLKASAWESSIGWVRILGRAQGTLVIKDDGTCERSMPPRYYLSGDEHYREAREGRAFGKLKVALAMAERYGLTFLGAGYFGAAFLNEITDKVIKISASNSNDGWISFIQWAMANYDKYPQHLPKIYEFEHGDIFTYAIMDCMEDSIEGHLDNCSYHIPVDVSQEKYIDNLGLNIETHHPERITSKVPDSFMDCLYALWQAFEVGDCHSGNFMIYHGNLVLIDPIAWIDE